MKGLKTHEGAKFEAFFSIVQQEAERNGCVFYLESGEGHELITDTLDCEDLSGWLIPKGKTDAFEKEWKQDHVGEHWNDCITWAVWKQTNEGIRVELRQY